MKKFVLCCAALFAVSELLALRPGDAATKLERVRWVRGTGVVAEGVSKPRNSGEPELRAVVFLLCRAGSAPSTMALLDGLRREYSYRLRIGVLTPDSSLDADELLKKCPKDGVSFGLDLDRKITPTYMAGNLLYPMAFLIDDGGVIVWCGEAVDLPEAAERYFAGKLDLDVQKKVAPLIDQMQMLMRDNSERQMVQAMEEILDLDPGNASALRMRLFLLENSGRFAEALELLQDQRKAAPEIGRLYFTELDLLCRHPELTGKLPKLVYDFRCHVTDARMQLMMAWNLLRNCEFNAEALRAASDLLQATQKLLGNEPQWQAASALFAYRTGNLDQAIAHQNAAAEGMKKQSLDTTEVEKLAEFFRAAREIRR